MNIYDDLLFKSFIQNRGLKPTTTERYHNHLILYFKYLKKTLTELIDELRKKKIKE